MELIQNETEEILKLNRKEALEIFGMFSKYCPFCDTKIIITSYTDQECNKCKSKYFVEKDWWLK